MHLEHAETLERLWAGAGGSTTAPFGDTDRLREPLSRDGWSPLWTGLARVGGKLPPARQPDVDPWALLRGRSDPSGRGSANGRLVGEVGERSRAVRPWFDTVVPPQGYRWWYVDALSDDAQYGLTIIGFIGSVFSPYYKQSGRNIPLDHACLNIALYGKKARWVMTERGTAAMHQECNTLQIGPSAMRWEQDRLIIDIEERDIRLGIPWRRRVTGQIILHPEMLNEKSFKLDPAGRHHWQAIAPRARIEVKMQQPDIAWSGSGYLDSNHGSEPIEDGFQSWHWSRAHVGQGKGSHVAVIYEGKRRDSSHFASALRFGSDGVPQEVDLPLVAPLPRTWWAMERQTRADRGHASVIKTWEDSPFYARTALSARMWGEPVIAIQESISLDRLINPVVQFMLPYKMPREV
jgi:carotenoid 1,2-hydratase